MPTFHIKRPVASQLWSCSMITQLFHFQCRKAPKYGQVWPTLFLAARMIYLGGGNLSVRDNTSPVPSQCSCADTTPIFFIRHMFYIVVRGSCSTAWQLGQHEHPRTTDWTVSALGVEHCGSSSERPISALCRP